MRLSEAIVLIEAKTRSGKSEEDIYYHGTSTDMLPVILKQGLIPDPKDRAWDKDETRAPSMADRTSYGGIYVTRNLGTASSSASNHNNKKSGEYSPGIIVVMRLQPRSLVADEDELVFTGGVLDVMAKGASNSETVREWIYAAWKFGKSPESKQMVRDSLDMYEENLLAMAKKKLGGTKDKGGAYTPQLEARLKELSRGLWEAALVRSVAQFKEYSGSNWSYRWKRLVNDYSHPEYKWDDPDFPMPPEPAEAEQKFRQAVDQLTRTLKSIVRPKLNKASFSKNGRLLSPVTFRGQNRIVAIVKEMRGSKPDPYFRFKVVYGTLPDDFRSQWNERIGDVEKAEVK